MGESRDITDKSPDQEESLSFDSDSFDFDEMPPERIASLMIRAERTFASWASPLPPPAVLEAYERIYPGALEWVLRETTKQGDHRRDIERTAVNGNERRARLGLYFGFILGLGILALTAYSLWRGEPLWALALVVVTVGPISGAYGYVVHIRRNELKEKDAAVPE